MFVQFHSDNTHISVLSLLLQDVGHVLILEMLTSESDYLPKLVVVSESILAYSDTFTSQVGTRRRYFWVALCALDDSRHGREDAQTSKEILPGDLKTDGVSLVNTPQRAR